MFVTLCGKRESVDVIKLRIFSWGDYPRLSGPNVITRGLIRGAGGSVTEDVTREPEVRVKCLLPLKREGGAKSQGMQVASGS